MLNMKLGDTGNFARGKSKHRPRNDDRLYAGGGYPMVQTGDIKNSGLRILKHTQEYNAVGLAQSKLWPEGTLAITIAANIAEASILSYPMCFPDSVVGFSADKTKTTELFMYYLLAHLRSSIQNSVADTGSIQDNINLNYLQNLAVDVPELGTQKKIADLLSSLDQKIETINKINNEIEKTVRALYDYWFVQFDFPDASGRPYKTSGGEMVYNEELKCEIPVNWTAEKLKDLLEFDKGTEVGSKSYGNVQKKDSVRFYRVGDIDGSSTTFIDNRSTLNIVKPSDVIVTFDGTVGKLGLGLEGAISGGLRKIYDKTNTIDNSYIWLLFLDLRIKNTIERYATGSVLLHASSSINYLRMPFDKKTITQFQEVVKPMFEQYVSNTQESIRLTQLRNFLLPMLMNGQIIIKD